MSVRAPDFTRGEWLDGAVRGREAFSGRPVLLDFFTFGCMNCVNNLPMLRRLSRRYGDTLRIVGVHSGKFAYEKATPAVLAAVERLEIPWPVLNDTDGRLFDAFAVKAWPTLVLIDGRGYVAAEFRGEGQEEAIETALAALGYRAAETTERDGAQSRRELRFPEKLCLDGERLWVSDAHGVLGCGLDGRDARRYGGFVRAAGMAAADGKLYVADVGAHSVAVLDPDSGQTHTVLTSLRAPSALAVFGDVLAVAEAAAHTIAFFDRRTWGKRQVFGNRFEALRDGRLREAQLAQPSGMSMCDDGRLWFVDAESSALRFIDTETDAIHTAVGEGLFTFGDSDAEPILLQHPQDVACGLSGDGCGGGRLFVADTYNGKIKAYDPQSGRMMTLLAGLDMPAGVAKRGCRLYIAESGAHRIVVFDLPSMEASPLQIAL